MKDQKDNIQPKESNEFFERLEQATPQQISSAIIAKILQKIKKLRSDHKV